MCGHDGIYYEHIIHGGDNILWALSRLFTAMLKTGHIPANMNKGVIITLHKGAKKNKTDPNNYRAITLTSTILKLFENILLLRSRPKILSKLSKQQGGFQQNLGCIMTSFCLREAVLYAKENNSKVYVCFLDCRQAFDRVWHDGLLYKLNECDIDPITLRCFINLYSNMKSCVRNKSYMSDWFEVKQGTRQGGKSSPLLYLLYINGLILKLEQSNLGFCMYNMNISSPTVADDMVLVSLSKHGLDQMISICYRYSTLWRFEYNPSKCSVVVYNEPKIEYEKAICHRKWTIGTKTICEGIEYVHLGITLNKYSLINDNIYNASCKLRGILLSIANSGVDSGNDLNPSTYLKIYNSVVLPKALYGCELWNYMTHSNILTLERAHRFCVKFMQKLPLFVNNDIALFALGVNSIITTIDYNKLRFLGQLCRLPNHYLAKQIFVHRLVRYVNCIERQCLGFLPDIYKLLAKYNLTSYMNIFLETSRFPSKGAWKSILQCNLFQREINLRYENLCQKLSLEHISNIFNIGGQCKFWIYSKNFPAARLYCFSALTILAKLFSFNKIEACKKCNCVVENSTLHLLMSCSCNEQIRVRMWKAIISNCGITAYKRLISTSPLNQVLDLLAGVYFDDKNFLFLIKTFHKMIT
jgi:hypothetical protein